MATLSDLHTELTLVNCDGTNAKTVQKEIQTFITNVTARLRECQREVSRRSVQLATQQAKYGGKLGRIERLINKVSKNIASHRDLLLDDYQELSSLLLEIIQRTTQLKITAEPNKSHSFLYSMRDYYLNQPITSTLSRHIQQANIHINRMNMMSSNFRAEILAYPHKDCGPSVMIIEDVKEIDELLQAYANQHKKLNASELPAPEQTLSSLNSNPSTSAGTASLTRKINSESQKSGHKHVTSRYKHHIDQLTKLLRQITHDSQLSNHKKQVITIHLKGARSLLKSKD